jgi:hypothetical protein
MSPQAKKVVKPPKYRRSTPVIRLRRNVAKLARHADLVVDRLNSWGASEDPSLGAVLETVMTVVDYILQLDAQVGVLEDTGFVPLRRSAAIVFDVGQEVAIIAKHRQKYREAFESQLKEDPMLLDGLVVRKIIKASGEVVVQRGSRTPFIARKSHLTLVK